MAFSTVQHNSGTGVNVAPSVTLAATPIQGNLLVAAIDMAQSTLAVTMSSAGWTALTQAQSSVGGNRTSRLFWKIAGASESKTVTAANTSGAWVMAVAEYSPGALTTVAAPTENAQANSSGTTTTPAVTPTAGRAALVVVWIAETQQSTWSAEKVNASTTGIQTEETPSRLNASGALFDLPVASTSGTYQGSATPGTAAIGSGNIAVFTGTTTFTDAPSGSLGLSGSLSESRSAAESPAGALALAGAVSEARSAAEAPAGAAALTGSLTESRRGADSPAGAVSATGTAVESRTATEAPSGALAGAGSLSESRTATDTATGSLTPAGALTEGLTRTAAPSGSLTLAGALTETVNYTESPAGQLTLAGTVTDSHTVIIIDAVTRLTDSARHSVTLTDAVLGGCTISENALTAVLLADRVLGGCATADRALTPVGLADAPLDPP